MGLDQYAYVNAKTVEDKNGNTYLKGEQEITWRKHARLQEFMEKLWREKGNEKEFNCVDLQLTKHDLEELQKQVESNYYDHFSTGGLFWGHQFQEEMALQYLEQDRKFVADALQAVEKGNTVVYSCWW
jgi:hypothetical protein